MAVAATQAAQAAAPASDVRARCPKMTNIFSPPRSLRKWRPRNDRGGLKGDRLATGSTRRTRVLSRGPTSRGVAPLDYLQGWGDHRALARPVFKNKPVQGPPGNESSAITVYWITDFTAASIRTLGPKPTSRRWSCGACARDEGLYGHHHEHTADVLHSPNAAASPSAPTAAGDYPFSGAACPRAAINPALAATSSRPPRISRGDRSKLRVTVQVSEAERRVKKPDWLNDPIYYHNRGNTIFRNESAQMGDFVGLDDLFTNIRACFRE